MINPLNYLSPEEVVRTQSPVGQRKLSPCERAMQIGSRFNAAKTVLDDFFERQKNVSPMETAQEFINCKEVVKLAKFEGIELEHSASNDWGDFINACDYCNHVINLESVGKKTRCPILNKYPHLKEQLGVRVSS